MVATLNIIGVQEKKELTKILTSQYDRLISQMKNEIEFTQGELLEEAHKKFGVKVLNEQIKSLEKQIEIIKQKKTDLGFGGHSDTFSTKRIDNLHYEQQIDPNSKAGRFYYLKVGRCADIKGLEKERDQKLKDIWLENDRAIVKTLVNTEVKPQQIAYKVKK